MKQNEISSNTLLSSRMDAFGDDHILTSMDTPLREDAFEMSDELKMELIEKHFTSIMEILGLDLADESLMGTPARVAKMYVKEVFSGLDQRNKPIATLFENNFRYDQMLVEKNITLFTTCEHHFVPIYGKAHVAYFPKGQVVGLSKLNRIVQYYGKRPQVQERLTEQIAKELKDVLKTEDVAVLIDAKHMCVSMRGVEDAASSTVTAHYGGKFQEVSVKKEFLKYIK